MPAVGFNTLRSRCQIQLPYSRFSETVKATTQSLRHAILSGRQIPLLSKQIPGLDQIGAYEISAANCALSIQAGLIPIGRKIGFTNTKIWPEYNVSEPNWGYLWAEKCRNMSSPGSIQLPPATLGLQPRIEPEIVFCLKSIPHSQMTEQECLACIHWFAAGYEIVVSPFKDWKFTGVDTTAVNALHHRLYYGKRHHMSKYMRENLVDRLQHFGIGLFRNTQLVATGKGANVLGSPIKALLYLCRMLESQTMHPGLSAGEIITTGTLTNAMPISPGETWSTKFREINLSMPDMTVEVTSARGPKRQIVRLMKEKEQATNHLDEQPGKATPAK